MHRKKAILFYKIYKKDTKWIQKIQVRKHAYRKLYACLLCTILTGSMLLGGCGKASSIYLEEAAAYGEERADSDSDQGSAGNPMVPQTEADENGTEGEICVYVCGEVRDPGLYTLKAGSRVYDAIMAAGGLSEMACQDYWNQAEYVSDGQMINVPTEEEAGQGDLNGTEAVTGTAGTDAEGRININTASKEELLQIPGVGDARADAIIRYREESGGFSSIEEIMNVSGIKDGLFEKMKDDIIAN